MYLLCYGHLIHYQFLKDPYQTSCKFGQHCHTMLLLEGRKFSFNPVTALNMILEVCMFISTIWAHDHKFKVQTLNSFLSLCEHLVKILTNIYAVLVHVCFLTLYHKEESSTKTFQMLTQSFQPHNSVQHGLLQQNKTTQYNKLISIIHFTLCTNIMHM